MNVFLCLAGQAAAAGTASPMRGRDCWGSEQGWARLGCQTQHIKAPSAKPSQRPWWTNTGQRGKISFPLALPFVLISWTFIGDLRRNESPYLREMWKCLKRYSLQRWGVRLWALFFQKKTVRTPSWPRRCEVGWIHLLPPNSSRQSGREITFTVWLL